MKLRISWQVYPIPELPHRWELRHNYVVDKAILPLFLFPSFSRQSRDTPSSRRRGPCYHLLSPVHRLRAVVALCDNNEHTIVSSSCTRNPSRVDKSYITGEKSKLLRLQACFLPRLYESVSSLGLRAKSRN